MRPRSGSYQRNSMSPLRQYEYRRRSRSPIPQRRNRSPSRSVSRSRFERHDRRRRDASPIGEESYRRRIDAPPKTRCLGVFGLSGMTTESTIHKIFSHYGVIKRINIVYDTHTGRSRGFCFIYYDRLSDAIKAKDALSGIEIDNRRIRVDYSITQRPHDPTPGIYKGKRSETRDRVRDRDRDPPRRRTRSPSPRHRTTSSPSPRRHRATPSPSPRRRRTPSPSPRRHRRRNRSPVSRSP